MEKQVELKFLTSSIEVVVKTIGKMVQAIQDKQIVIDPEVQRKLDHKRKREIAQYIRDALEGKSFGAYFGPIVSSRRKNGIYAILDGQHRFFGAWEALIQIQQEIKELLDTEGENKEKLENLIQVEQEIKELLDTEGENKEKLENLIQVEQEIKELLDTEEKNKEKLDKLMEHASIIENSVIPMMAYVGLTKEQEQQLFHDLNNKGKKVSQSLTLSFNHSDPFVNLTRTACEFEYLKPHVQPLHGKSDKEKLFTFKNVYTTVSTFFGKKEEISNADPEYLLNELEDFFKIVTDSFPEDVVGGEYLYRHAGILPGIALFANRMKKIEGVCWRNTLKNALSRVSFSNRNIQFVRIGKALLDQEKKVTFSGSKGAISAVVKTLEQESLRLDKDGNEVIQAYYSGDNTEPVVIVSDEVAATVEQEVKEIEQGEVSKDTANNQDDPEASLSASQKAILKLIDDVDSKSIVGSYTQIAERLNFARSTTTDALKKLEFLGMIEITDDNGIKTVKRRV
jgi:hypothetical protein